MNAICESIDYTLGNFELRMKMLTLLREVTGLDPTGWPIFGHGFRYD